MKYWNFVHESKKTPRAGNFIGVPFPFVGIFESKHETVTQNSVFISDDSHFRYHIFYKLTWLQSEYIVEANKIWS